MKRFEIHIKEINLNEDLEPIEKKEVETSCIVDDKLTPTTEELVKEVLEHKWADIKRYFLEIRNKEHFTKYQSLADYTKLVRKALCEEIRVRLEPYYGEEVSGFIVDKVLDDTAGE